MSRHTWCVDAQQVNLLKGIDPKVLGQRIRASRMAKGLTQGQIAGQEASVAYVSRIEAGQRRPSSKLLEQFAVRLKTTVDDLLLGPNDEQLGEMRLALDYAELSLEYGEGVDAEAQTNRVLAYSGDGGPPCDELHRRALYLHARALETQGRLDDAILDLEHLVGQGGSDLPWVRANIALSRCYREAGDLSKAIEVGQPVLGALAANQMESSDEAVQLVVTMAAAYFERGDLGRAIRLCRKAIATAEEFGSPAARAAAYWNASLMESQRGAVVAAIPLARKALALLGEGQDARNLARLRSALGIMQLRLDPPEIADAEENLKRASRELLSSSASPLDIARNEVALARALYMAGDLSEARDLAHRTYIDTVGLAPLIAADARALEGQAAAGQGDVTHANDAYRDAILILTGVGADRTAAQLWFELAGLLEEVGAADAARDAYRSAAASTGLTARASVATRRK